MIDLHTHSNYSDGSDTPAAVVELAAKAGCSTIALTDHDTVGGVNEAINRGHQLGVRVIPGVELSCRVGEKNVHILGYFMNAESDVLQQRLAAQRRLRNERNLRLLDRLNELGLAIDMEQVLVHAGEDSVGRPHFAAALVAAGHVATIDDAFADYLAEGAPGYVEREELSAAEGIAWIRDCGGVASWAHPMSPSTSIERLQPSLSLLIDLGLDGLEARYSRYDRDLRAALITLAQRHRLVATGGSDYHGEFKRGLRLGSGEGDLHVPDEVVDELEARRSNN